MTDYEARIGGDRVEPNEDGEVLWVDRGEGIAHAISPGGPSQLVVVEGTGQEWWVTIRGRRIAVEVRTWREVVLAEAEGAAATSGGPAIVTATLPGLIVAVAVSAGDEVEEGASLLTIEAMKMQNEVRAPRAGRVAEVSVAAGQAVATGTTLLRLE